MELISHRGAATVKDLARELEASCITVRRDIDYLARQGSVLRVHGGALTTATVPGGRADSGPLVMPKIPTWTGRVAASTVMPKSHVGIPHSQWALELARNLTEIPDLTIVTNSIPVADLLHRSRPPGLTLVVAGGSRGPTGGINGPLAQAMLRGLELHRVFFGADGLGRTAGVTTRDLEDVPVLRSFAEAAKRISVIAGKQAWLADATASYLTLNQVDEVFTDDEITPAAVELLRSHSIHLSGQVRSSQRLVVEGPPRRGDHSSSGPSFGQSQEG